VFEARHHTRLSRKAIGRLSMPSVETKCRWPHKNDANSSTLRNRVRSIVVVAGCTRDLRNKGDVRIVIICFVRIKVCEENRVDIMFV